MPIELFIPYVKLTPSSVTTYDLYQGSRVTEKNSKVWETNFSNNSTRGLISKSAYKKIQNQVNWLVFLSPLKKTRDPHTGKFFYFRVNFITLTLSSKQRHDDQFIKKNLFHQFLVEMKKNYQMEFYLWRAESQKNGNIHFHITTNVYIPHYVIKSVWNRIQEKYGYVTNFAEDMNSYFADGFKLSSNPNDKRSFYQQYKAYIWNKIINWTAPNSTDVHSVKNVKNLGAYLAKYLTKEDQYRKIAGRLWDSSYKLKKFHAAVSVQHQAIKEDLNYLAQHYPDKVNRSERANYLNIGYEVWSKLPVPALINLFNTYFSQIKFDHNFL